MRTTYPPDPSMGKRVNRYTFYCVMNVDSGDRLCIDMNKIVRKELQIEENQVT